MRPASCERGAELRRRQRSEEATGGGGPSGGRLALQMLRLFLLARPSPVRQQRKTSERSPPITGL